MTGYDFSEVKFLVVDDNSFMTKLYERMLKAFGAIHIDCEFNGEDALAAIRQSPPDIMISDWGMAPVNGFELASAVRAEPDERLRQLPILMVSGYSDKERVLEARDFGVTEFLAKPHSALDLSKRLTAIIEQPRPFFKTTSYFGPCRRRGGMAELCESPMPTRRRDDRPDILASVWTSTPR